MGRGEKKHGSSVVAARDARSGAFQVDGCDSIADFAALDDQVAEVLPRNLALALDLARVFAFGSELLDGALQADAQIVCGGFQDFADRRRNAIAIRMNVVDSLELGRDLTREAIWQGVWDLTDDVVHGGDCYGLSASTVFGCGVVNIYLQRRPPGR